jgi:carboxymethylenebutenolidase
MRTESLDASYLALPDGVGPYPGVIVIHEASGLNDNIRGIRGRWKVRRWGGLARR